jgi:hypothetical protein
MHTLTAIDTKTHFDQLMQTSLTQSVRIENNGHELVSVVSSQKHQRPRKAVFLSRSQWDGFMAARDAPLKPNGAFKRGAERYAKLVHCV